MGKKDNPLVTIAIPAYKASFLKEAIKSALNQTYEQIEVIVVNDCSPEPIEELVRALNDSRLKYYENTQNIGGKDPVANWNRCLSLSQGEYFALLCDDDIYENNFIEKMLELAKKYPRCNVFRGRVREIDYNGNTNDYFPASPEIEDVIDYLVDLEGGFRRQTISEFLFRKDHIIELGGYSPLPMAWYSDHKSIAVFGWSGGIASSPEILVGFRKSGINITSEKDKNIIAKFTADNLYSEWINQISKEIAPEKSLILKQHRTNKELQMKRMYIIYSKWKDIVYLWNNRDDNRFLISKKLFLKWISYKILFTISRKVLS